MEINSIPHLPESYPRRAELLDVHRCRCTQVRRKAHLQQIFCRKFQQHSHPNELWNDTLPLRTMPIAGWNVTRTLTMSIPSTVDFTRVCRQARVSRTYTRLGLSSCVRPLWVEKDLERGYREAGTGATSNRHTGIILRQRRHLVARSRPA